MGKVNKIMINEENAQNAFQMILYAGDGRNNALEAISKAKEYKFEEAESLLNEAKENLKKAHKLQTKMMQDEINGTEVELSILTVHGQDHFAMATLSIDLARQAIEVYKKFKELEDKK